ncbi:MAG TPA: biotin transporter BioY [Thermoclostridium sp.]|nr:biotin transporter BioY [Clostridiaceae bacterium]HOQ76231.1 biotin transporter BioY [Thermoclostridium sp.]HPU45122.1 biotin transporter BioY [Thermoclostridium sp.]
MAKKLGTRDIVQIALFSALTAVGAFIRAPLPFIPFTLQTFFVALSGALLGSKRGMMAQLLYVAVGLTGVPVFSKGGGIGYVLQPTFGYLIGFIFSAWLTGLLVERLKEARIMNVFACILAGLAVTYLCGVTYLYLMTNLYLKNVMPLGQAIYYGFIVTIGGDLLTLYPASVLVARLKPALRKAGLAGEP